MTTLTQLPTKSQEPPTSEEMLAYQRGKLSPEEQDRFRERLIDYPELVQTLVAEFPTEGAEPGDPDYLSDAEFRRHWAAMRKQPPRGAVVQFWPWMAAIAATLALVFGALFWQSQAALRQPHVRNIGEYYIEPGPTRGGDEPKIINPRGDEYVLVPVIMDPRLFETYRIEIRKVDVTPPRSLWSMAGFRRHPDDTLLVTIPRAFLDPGRYQLVLYGTLGPHEDPVGTYDIRIPEVK